MSQERKKRIEFGDWQTPIGLAEAVCARLIALGIHPEVIIEPTCGVGAFIHAAARAFPRAEIHGSDVNGSYLDVLRDQLGPQADRIHLEQADFFSTDWRTKIRGLEGALLVLGNFPWVTNSAQGSFGGSNLPEKSNFLQHKGFDAISGKANFDISESMMIEVLRWFRERDGDIAMLIKTATARKVLAHAQRQAMALSDAWIIHIDAKKDFNAAVGACLLVMRMDRGAHGKDQAYLELPHLEAVQGRRVGYRMGLPVNDLDAFDAHARMLGHSPQKWRSGIKHDAAKVMELTRKKGGYVNGAGACVQLEEEFLYPLMKGSDIGSNKAWREKFVLVTQQAVGANTDVIRQRAPLTWAYLEQHGQQLDRRGSAIYAKNPRFSVFGVGPYAFRPWRIAICGLYKKLQFRLIGPIEDRPVMFDDTVYYVSFHSEAEARTVLEQLSCAGATAFLSSLIFWDEKRPIKTSILNLLNWSAIASRTDLSAMPQLDFFTP